MTFTALARDARTGLIGAATASRSLAVGNAVIEVRAGVGAAASQAWTNRGLRGLLLDAVTAGHSATDAMARIAEWDDAPQLRQAALLPVRGHGAAHTGDETSPWSGHLVADDLVVAGNLLTGPDVVEAVRDAWLAGEASTTGPDDIADAAARLGDRLVRALLAGEARGGDRRGRQSAAVAVAATTATGQGWLDLRVDDHPEPLIELRRLIALRDADVRAAFSARKA